MLNALKRRHTNGFGRRIIIYLSLLLFLSLFLLLFLLLAFIK